MPRIGELLVAEGILSEVAVQSALGFQRHTGEPFRLGTILLDRDLLGEESLMRALSAIHRCDYVAWSEILQAAPHIVRLLPERTAVRLGAIPYGLEGRGLRVAFKNPSNLAAVDEVSAVTGRPVVPAVISEVRLVQALNLFFGRQVPIEFRNVLIKLERNEERRLYRNRATVRADVASPAAPPRAGEDVRPISIEGDHPAPEVRVPVPIDAAPPAPSPLAFPVSRPEDSRAKEPDAGVQYTPPFASAEIPTLDLADASDFLPGYAPPRTLSPDEQAARMWKADAQLPEIDDHAAGAMWTRARPVAPAPEAPLPKAPLPESPAPAAPEPTSARDQVAEALLDDLAQRFPRVLLLTSAHESVQGWTARGGGLTRDVVSRVRIPWGEPSIFAFVKLSGSPHRGPLSRILMPPVLTDMLGPKAVASCGVYPVRIKDRLIAFLYADRVGAPLSDEDHRSLEIAASSLGSSLARLLLELRRGVPPSSF
jgi:MshEN domain